MTMVDCFYFIMTWEISNSTLRVNGSVQIWFGKIRKIIDEDYSSADGKDRQVYFDVFGVVLLRQNGMRKDEGNIIPSYTLFHGGGPDDDEDNLMQSTKQLPRGQWTRFLIHHSESRFNTQCNFLLISFRSNWTEKNEDNQFQHISVIAMA